MKRKRKFKKNNEDRKRRASILVREGSSLRASRPHLLYSLLIPTILLPSSSGRIRWKMKAFFGRKPREEGDKRDTYEYGSILPPSSSDHPSPHDANELHISKLETTAIIDSDDNIVLDPSSTTVFNGQASRRSEVATMTKSLVGCGVLSLPGGIALYSNSPLAILSAITWTIVMGIIFGYFCLLIGKLCQITQQTTYRACWENSVGPARPGALIVSIANATKAGLADLAYSTILSQTLVSLFQTMGLHVSRVECLWIITILAILPLCMLQNLHVLAPFSVAGTLGILWTMIAMNIRYMDGSYQPGGRFFDDVPLSLQPDLSGNRNLTWTMHSLPFVCMLYESFVMHYNSPRFYVELKNASVLRFGHVVTGSFGISTVIYSIIACTGYLTFGGNSSGYILNNYSPHDPLATSCRLAIAFAILLTYPLAFIGMRDGVLNIFNVPMIKRTGAFMRLVTVGLLGLITLIACFVSDLGRINAVG